MEYEIVFVSPQKATEEAQSDRSDCLQGPSTLFVKVPEGFTVLDSDDETDCIDTDLDIDAVKTVNEWREAGYPIVWR